MLSIDDTEVQVIMSKALDIVVTIEAYKDLLENRCNLIEAMTGINSEDVSRMVYGEYKRCYPLSLVVTSNPMDHVDNKLSDIIGEEE